MARKFMEGKDNTKKLAKKKYPKAKQQKAYIETSKLKNKKAMGMAVGLIVLFLDIMIFIVLIPGLVDVIDEAKRSDALNCAGYDHDDSGTVGDNQYDYNSTIGTKSTMACTAIKLYIPYIALAVLIGAASLIVMRKSSLALEPTGY